MGVAAADHATIIPALRVCPPDTNATFMIEWNIQPRSHGCQACQSPFADRQPYHTLLFDERAGYQRLDVCENCWTQQYNQATSRKGFVSHWQGVYAAPQPQPELVRRETAETLLRKLMALADPNYAAATFILAVMLERKRLLKVKDQVRQDNRRLFIYEHPASGDVFTVIDPDLSLAQLDDVQRSVALLLEHGIPETPAQSVPTPDPNPAPGSPIPSAPPPATAQPA